MPIVPTAQLGENAMAEGGCSDLDPSEVLTAQPTCPTSSTASTASDEEDEHPNSYERQVMALLKEAEKRYLQENPRSEVAFIWAFLERVDGNFSDDDRLCWHIQAELAKLVDKKFVERVRPRRNNGKRRIVIISPKFTWHQFTHALRKMSLTPWSP